MSKDGLAQYPRKNLWLIFFLAIATISFCLAFWFLNSTNRNEPLMVQGVTYAYYNISGGSEGEIRENLNKFGPFDSDSVRYDALTKWQLSWNWEGYGTDKPKYDTIKVNLMALVIAPKLESEDKISNEIKSKWNKYLSALIAHEQRHLEIAVKCREEILMKIKLLTNESGEEVANKILMKYKTLEMEMDKISMHGQVDGAKFP